MIIEQRRLLAGTTQLALRPNGLYICQRNSHGRATLEFEMPYEEVLPVRVMRFRTTPQLTWRPLVGLWFAISLLQRLLPTNSNGQLSDAAWLGVFGFGGLLIALYLYGQRNWWQHVTLGTSRTNITLADRSAERASVDKFARALEARTKAYLREEYANINPLGLIDTQLHRLRWLRKLDVLTEREARVLATRLTGRLDSLPLHSMGQVLESPYVN
ncbi:hypothetical protein J0X19_00045 [Hymenobacter sp. BT186]|uniref:Uncharacterized protein n=1 Tax=Hymenobacter telluris TaxID=2816474 RepID=A0A939J8S7_9BACT|nr:hypothetical protein [Hymenobacter telluris]MBO0356321.1 hypothetical protein [Hymenobacter telluris]MBW3372345.1 hypothetical protein [Hymenobacter norwichensis]